jgi:hypothetical protein
MIFDCADPGADQVLPASIFNPRGCLLMLCSVLIGFAV